LRLMKKFGPERNGSEFIPSTAKPPHVLLCCCASLRRFRQHAIPRHETHFRKFKIFTAYMIVKCSNILMSGGHNRNSRSWRVARLRGNATTSWRGGGWTTRTYSPSYSSILICDSSFLAPGRPFCECSCFSLVRVFKYVHS
jgi:hypothetical protein